MSGKTLYPKRIPVFIEGDPVHEAGEAETTPGTEQTLVTKSVLSGKTLNMLQVNVSCFQEGRMRVMVGSTRIASARTGAGYPNAPFFWVKPKTIAGPATIEIRFKAIAGTPRSDVEAYLDAALTDS